MTEPELAAAEDSFWATAPAQAAAKANWIHPAPATAWSGGYQAALNRGRPARRRYRLYEFALGAVIALSYEQATRAATDSDLWDWRQDGTRDGRATAMHAELARGMRAAAKRERTSS